MTNRVLDVVLSVQGEGRGHMTQALAVREFLADAGHRVVAVYLGTSTVHPAPPYFADRIDAPLTTFPAPTLATDRDTRGMSVAGTVTYNARRLPSYVAAGLAMRADIRRRRPDVVVNFFDLIAGFARILDWRRGRPGRVALAHAYLMDHPGAATPPSGATERLGMGLLCSIAAAGAGAPLGLSFDELPPVTGLRVVPPLLRPGLDRITPRNEGYLLAYALNPGYARELAAWQARTPGATLHCYVPGGGRGMDLPDQEGLHLHDLDDEGFIQHLAGCRAYAGTAGFESVCEAHYLGKPVLAVPVDRHFEQAFNAADIRRAGVARTGTFQDLDSFWDQLPIPAPSRVETFRRWVSRAPQMIVDAVEQAARA